MKKLRMETPLLLSLASVSVIVLFALALLLSAQTVEQTAKVEPEVSLELTEVESLKLSLVLKDILLAAQQLQIIQATFQGAVAQRDARQKEFDTMLAGLRIVHKAPADKFSFNPNTMKFVPVPQKEKTEEKVEEQ